MSLVYYEPTHLHHKKSHISWHLQKTKQKQINNYKNLLLDQIIMIRHNNLGQTTTTEAIDKHMHTTIETHTQTQHLLDSKQITGLKQVNNIPKFTYFFLSGVPLSLCQVWRWKHITLAPREGDYPHFKWALLSFMALSDLESVRMWALIDPSETQLIQSVP